MLLWLIALAAIATGFGCAAGDAARPTSASVSEAEHAPVAPAPHHPYGWLPTLAPVNWPGDLRLCSTNHPGVAAMLTALYPWAYEEVVWAFEEDEFEEEIRWTGVVVPHLKGTWALSWDDQHDLPRIGVALVVDRPLDDESGLRRMVVVRGAGNFSFAVHASLPFDINEVMFPQEWRVTTIVTWDPHQYQKKELIGSPFVSTCAAPVPGQTDVYEMYVLRADGRHRITFALDLEAERPVRLLHARRETTSGLRPFGGEKAE